ncbi:MULTISPECIES: flagellar biosynthetic protein FliR [Marichromatium]|uniref:Flagellar biosynthetic protein FliR n=1 Tax=Marichromatium gracile TaxID=1048 RepID=A0A4R4A5C6_MARGR|nr:MULTISPECIES: flagellar biosynthetic protein FliR [Marichromatium]MBO8086823.1 flagellar biosynthetic protein FliR [Marichromatium sp.]MBK1708123.1 flagellar biosynthetic protein FliR [Marichromatium gracile]RNE89641.1 flagellar biosynthetic protein FliR [Marichromatium sp. AB31]RNE94719.1 flagellar biosynthetic protein FliR [Marichromatium sp. AB32]TCW33420.1 flagellar biosynthetic protein FliR [Marichromatium gracile]
MVISFDTLLDWVGMFVWPFVRISAMLLVAPIFGARTVNARVRLSLGLLLAILVAPLLPPFPAIDPLSMEGLVVALQQVLIGVMMGFVAQLVFAAVTLAGESIALSMGLGFASVIDPAGGVQVPMVSQYFVILTTLLFLAFDAHLVLLQLMTLSFEVMPVGMQGLVAEDFWRIAGFGTTMFAGALLIALPAVASLLLVNLAMGVVTRAAPQLNIFAVGFPVTLLMGFVLIILILPGLPARIGDLLTAAFLLIQRLLGV